MKALARLLAVFGLLVGLLITAAPVAAGQSRSFPETGQTSSNAFYDFWLTHGVWEILGMPLSPTYTAKTGFLTQVYERAVMEWHPDNTGENRVQIGRSGALFLDDLIGATSGNHRKQGLEATAARGCVAISNCETFATTKHTVIGAFRDYWHAHGGLATFGYPLTEQAPLCQGDTNGSCDRTVSGQMFERSVFEWHPETDGGTILLRRLGADYWDTVKNRESIQGVTVPTDNGGAAAPIYNPPSASVSTLSPADNPPPQPSYTGSVSGSVCPAGYPIKANDNNGIYQVPGGAFYDVTNARNCFATTAAARAAGYQANKG